MSTIEEKRVYADKSAESRVYLASDLGVVRVSVSGNLIGNFGIKQRCVARDLAWIDGLVVATDEDVLLGGEPTGFGTALAVGGTESPIAASPEGRIARYEGGEWSDLGTLAGIRAADGDLLATADGVYRADGELTHVGLEGANDVSTSGTPLAATDTGLYRLGNGWMRDLDGVFDRVSGVGAPGELALGAALADDTLSLYDGEWRERETPEPLAAAAVGEAVYGATDEGTLYVDAGDGWRSQALGVSGVRALLVA
ncbi:HVO_0234 family beta-propeller protein [Halalkalicoccus jeotgali]|uniref:HVO-0234-like beta-propeller domain-containing protein n=1 Tax=Halalkalicoccus jeotgali (strain DSM 18796 / CECT 7217 / JCM 14584 / KCTC 4019 / B3) TaxID=795797 RepID=D8J3V4_HALJB|nr:hypothetical protein [Halalkalicoccus jeotgali]ADJ13445.1 hypothetical protein HacjB3_00260 [Halalkalicoccus jeotgali B3]ELY33080.1 hypothetical protein C497_19072 [Halalkalicoccus jeotgali B3]